MEQKDIIEGNMKLSIIFFFVLIFCTSIIIKPRPRDCDCGIKIDYYYKGKYVKTRYAKYGLWQRQNADEFYIGNNRLRCDSMEILPD